MGSGPISPLRFSSHRFISAARLNFQQKMGKRGKEPDVSEFISAMAAGNNAQLMVMASSGTAGSTALALVAAARQTGGRVVCILPSSEYSAASEAALGGYSDCVKFVVGDVKTLLREEYRGADFTLIDCNIADHKAVFRAAQERLAARGGGKGVIVGYNAFRKGAWSTEYRTHFLPIGEGLLVTRIGGDGVGAAVGSSSKIGGGWGGSGSRKRSRWIVKVDKWTGEEHVFRITPSAQIKA